MKLRYIISIVVGRELFHLWYATLVVVFCDVGANSAQHHCQYTHMLADHKYAKVIILLLIF